MIEDPRALDQAQHIVDRLTRIRAVLAERLPLFRRGLGEIQSSVDTTVRLYEQTLNRGESLDVGNPFVIAVFRRSKKWREESVYRFLADGTVEREGVIVEEGVSKIYGKEGLTPLPISYTDSEILFDLARDPLANFPEVASLSFLDGKARSLRASFPRRSAARR